MEEWTAYPFWKESMSHKALLLIFNCIGIPLLLIADNAKVLQMGKYKQKCKEADCYTRSPELFSPWQVAAEGTIRELKKGNGRKMILTKSPNALWDNCIKLKAYIRSNTTHDNYSLQGTVPETKMTGQASDISSTRSYQWYQWVMWYDKQAKISQGLTKAW